MATIQMKVSPEDLSQVPKGGEKIPETRVGVVEVVPVSATVVASGVLPAPPGLLPPDGSIGAVCGAWHPIASNATADTTL